MFHKDVSYLYSDEWLSSFTPNEKQSAGKASTFPTCRSTCARAYQKTTPISSIHHRSKHILVFREDNHQRNDRRDKTRLAGRRLKEKLQLLEDHVLKTGKLLEDEQSEFEDDFRQSQAYQRNFESGITDSCYGNSPTELSFNDKGKLPSLYDLSLKDLKSSSTSGTNVKGIRGH